MIVYAICLVLGLLFTIVSALLGHIFGGHDADSDIGTGGHAEAGFDHSGIPGLSFFSPTVLAAFVTAFGGLGIIFSQIDVTKSVWVSAPLSIAGAVGVAYAVLALFNAVFKRTQSSSESRVATLIGHEASVITPIPAGGVGEIAYVQSGTRYSAPARSENGGTIPSGRTVKITRIVGSQFYVTEEKQS
jgi:membrane protein implicated in regulation of membrane protease activity